MTMRPQRIYLDTSVIGGCFDTEFAILPRGLVEDFRAGRSLPVLSEVVAAEIESAPDRVRNQFTEIANLARTEVLKVTHEVVELAEAYQARQIVSPKYDDDGTHIALATVAEVDVLVSWNFKHIVHYEKIRLFNAVNLERGFKPLQIFSPREVTFHGVN
jgi:hypothetical protein